MTQIALNAILVFANDPVKVENVSALFERSLKISAADSEGSAREQRGELEAEKVTSGPSAGSESVDSHSLPVAPIAPVTEDSPTVDEEPTIHLVNPLHDAPSEPPSSPPCSLSAVKASPAPIGAENVFLSDHIQKLITVIKEEDGIETRMAHRVEKEAELKAGHSMAGSGCSWDNAADPMEWEPEDREVLLPDITGESSGYSPTSPPPMDWEPEDPALLEIPRLPNFIGEDSGSSLRPPTAPSHKYSPAVQAWFEEIAADRRRFAEKLDLENFQQRLLDEQRRREEVLQEQRRLFINSNLLPYLRPSMAARREAYFWQPAVPEGPKATPIGPVRTKKRRVHELPSLPFGRQGWPRPRWIWC
ncbi:hypothetical protein RUND412_004353 [Rhizina undulata]